MQYVETLQSWDTTWCNHSFVT